MKQRLQDLRHDHDLSQKQLAKILNMSQPGYSKYETGENHVPVYALIRLATLYDTSIDFLLGMTNESCTANIRKSCRPIWNKKALSVIRKAGSSSGSGTASCLGWICIQCLLYLIVCISASTAAFIASTRPAEVCLLSATA